MRRTALHAVTRIPVSLLVVSHLPALETLAMDALQARDCSYQTSATVGDLTRLLFIRGAQLGETAFPETALRLTARLAEHKRTLNLSGLHHNLPRGAEQRLFTALRPRLDADAARDEWDLALELAHGLDRRAYDIPELQRLLVRACAAHSDSTVRRAVRLALANPVSRDAHLDQLLRHDRSLVALPEVQAIIARRRTDLLDLLWSASTSGRFLSKKIRFVPMFHTGYSRWTPQHLGHYTRLLGTYAGSARASVGERAGAVRQLGSLPGSFDQLLPYLRSADLTVAEAALTALGGSDEPARAMAVLSEYVAADSARVAVSGMASCARSIPPARLSEALAPLLNSPKITSAKEGVRLLAALHAPDAIPIIRALWSRPDLHRDIRRAAVFSTRFLLDHEEAWELLADAAADPDVAGAILDIQPWLLPAPQRRRFASFLRDLAAGSDHRLANQALNALPRWRRWAPPETVDALVDRLTDLTDVGLWRSAARTLLDTVAATGDAAPLTIAVTRLLRAGDTIPDRDLPAQQRLSTLLADLGPILRDRDSARPVAAPIIALLADDPLWHKQVIELTVAGLRWTEPETTVAAIESLAPYASCGLIGTPSARIGARIMSDIGKHPAQAWTHIASRLYTSADISTALAALTVINLSGRKFGWTEPWADMLGVLRGHPEIDVRRAAHTVFTVAE